MGLSSPWSNRDRFLHSPKTLCFTAQLPPWRAKSFGHSYGIVRSLAQQKNRSRILTGRDNLRPKRCLYSLSTLLQ